MTFAPSPEMIEALRCAFNKIGVDLYGISSYEFRDAITMALASDPLIAAAPELLEALKETVEAVKIFHGPAAWDIYESKSPEMQRWKATIAKAEGRS